ncbi:hypothetical protein ACHAPJ_006715 [Fusarium lateritium]
MEGVYDAIQGERGPKDLAIIAVVSRGCSDELRKKSQKHWWQFWRGKTLVLITTKSRLQKAVDKVTKTDRIQSLVILASERVPEIYFNVQSSDIHTLKILKCGQGGKSEGMLLIDGASQFDGIYLDEWESHDHDFAQIYLGQNVCIQVDPTQCPAWSKSMADVPYATKQKVREYMSQTNESSQWDKWKLQVAAIVGTLVTGVKIFAKMDASASSSFFRFKLGDLALEWGRSSGSLSTVVTAAGPAVLLGAGAALAIYVIPWEKVFSWLEGVIGSWGSWFQSLWTRFCDWWYGGAQGPSSRTHRGAMPMSFA